MQPKKETFELYGPILIIFNIKVKGKYYDFENDGKTEL